MGTGIFMKELLGALMTQHVRLANTESDNAAEAYISIGYEKGLILRILGLVLVPCSFMVLHDCIKLNVLTAIFDNLGPGNCRSGA